MFLINLIVIFVISCAATYWLRKAASSIGLMALPDQHRQHETATPLLGGAAIFIGIAIGVVIFQADYVKLLPSLLLLCVTGLIDDRYSLPSFVRFIAQAISAYLMIKLTGVQLNNLGQLVNSEILYLGAWSIAITVFAVIGVINAINMSDGLDGLSGSLIVLVLSALLLEQSVNTILITVSIASVLGFLVWNLRLFVPRAKIFMGDAGSNMLGLLVAYCLIDASQQLDGLYRPVSALWLLALPLFDAVAVLIIRPIKGKSPFLADRIHYHHLIKDYGLSVNQTLVTILVLQTIFILIGLSLQFYGVAQNIQFFSFLTIFAIYIFMLFKCIE